MKNYLIIGASSGIGQELATLLSEEGHTVFASYHTNKKENTDHINYFHYDVTGQADFPEEALPEKIHGFAYCPGSINLKPFHRFKEEDFINDYKLQVSGAIKIMQTILPTMKAAGKASVVLFSTVAVQAGFRYHAQVSASKGALEGLTRALAAEWAPDIRVNAIAPSLTDTPLAEKILNTDQKREANAARHPLKTIGTPKTIADTAEFLLSDKSAWITGQIIQVDGGISTIKL